MAGERSRRALLLGSAGLGLGAAVDALTALGSLAAVGALGALSGCASPAVPLPTPVRLWGEVHDHPMLHAQRLVAFDALLASGERPALVLEMIDHDRQGELERLRSAGADAAALVAALGGRGWHWPFYQPYIERALRLGLPLAAANVGRDEARRIMADGLAAHGFDAAVPPPLLASQAALIEASHCGLVDGPRAARMALAQVARDQAMARAVQAHAGRGVLLLAGNGHVRRDIGVPVWLPTDLRQRVQVVGWVERGDTVAAFDERRVFDPHPRPDPCAGMRAPR
jgi:uncharacterized iron-regulated protein